MKKNYLLSIDQGTTSSRAVLFNNNGEIVSIAQKPFEQIYPKPGYVEHNANEILQTEISVIQEVVKNAGINSNEINAIGITNQRETTVAWSRSTGEPLYNAIVWQCRRTADYCEALKQKGLEDYIHKTTGLVIDAYFSGTKMKWMLDNVPEVREAADKHDLMFGTIDSWLLYKITGGKVHATDVTNASRTMLFNINDLVWDKKLLDELGIPEDSLPEVKSSAGYFGDLQPEILGVSIPITGIAGDQQSALFGQCCFQKGMAKNTYGTGCFVLANVGEKPVFSKNKMLTTIAWKVGNQVNYAIEGSVFNAGSSIKWIQEGLGIIDSPAQADMYAEKLKDTGGVYVVPAFTGLGAPYWDMYARGLIIGLTRGSTKEHIARAVLESIVYQSNDLFKAVEEDCGNSIHELRVDGGASRSTFLMQYQADISNMVVARPNTIETTAWGAAALAGLTVGVWRDMDELSSLWKCNRIFNSQMTQSSREKAISGWKNAVERSKNWVQ